MVKSTGKVFRTSVCTKVQTAKGAVFTGLETGVADVFKIIIIDSSNARLPP